MAQEIVAKLKVDTSNLGGAMGKMAGGGSDKFTGQFKENTERQTKDGKATAFAVTAGLATWEAIKKGIGFLMKASPMLAGTMKIFGQTMKILVKPIGDAFAMILRPFALAMLRWAIPVMRFTMMAVMMATLFLP